MLTKKQLFTRGMLDISPHMLSVIPFGIICGAPQIIPNGITDNICGEISSIPLVNNCFFVSIYLGSIKNKLCDQYLSVV